jgi:hypothetical protein
LPCPNPIQEFLHDPLTPMWGVKKHALNSKLHCNKNWRLHLIHHDEPSRDLGVQSLGVWSTVESTNITYTLIYDSLQIHCIILFYFMLVSNTLIKRECLYYVVGLSKHLEYQVRLIINLLCNLDFINNIVQKHISTLTLPWYQDEYFFLSNILFHQSGTKKVLNTFYIEKTCFSNFFIKKKNPQKKTNHDYLYFHVFETFYSNVILIVDKWQIIPTRLHPKGGFMVFMGCFT